MLLPSVRLLQSPRLQSHRPTPQQRTEVCRAYAELPASLVQLQA